MTTVTQVETVKVLHELHSRFESIMELAKHSQPETSYINEAKVKGIEFAEKELTRIITDLIEDKYVCPRCGADYQLWRETFNEEHYCDPNWSKR